jgi:hypothetical protein
MDRRIQLALPVVMLAFAAQALNAQASQAPEPAQNAQPAPAVQPAPAAQPVVQPAGPTIATAAVGVRNTKAEPPKTPPRFADTNQNKAMMIVGAAALITGAIIGDTAGTIFMVGGGVIGLIGLYHYLE